MTFCTGLNRNFRTIRKMIYRLTREIRVCQRLTEIIGESNVLNLPFLLKKGWEGAGRLYLGRLAIRMPTKEPGATKISRMPMIRPYRPVVSARAQPRISVDVTADLLSG